MMKIFKEYLTGLRNKIKYSGYELSDEAKYYYIKSNKLGLLSRITIIHTNTFDNYVEYTEEDIKTNKFKIVRTTFNGWSTVMMNKV